MLPSGFVNAVQYRGFPSAPSGFKRFVLQVRPLNAGGDQYHNHYRYTCQLKLPCCACLAQSLREELPVKQDSSCHLSSLAGYP